MRRNADVAVALDGGLAGHDEPQEWGESKKRVELDTGSRQQRWTKVAGAHSPGLRADKGPT
jgi:hypothetical protein